MTRVASRPKQSTFEEEKREAIESAIRGFAEQPDNRITQSACAYLLRHLRAERPDGHSNFYPAQKVQETARFASA